MNVNGTSGGVSLDFRTASEATGRNAHLASANRWRLSRGRAVCSYRDAYSLSGGVYSLEFLVIGLLVMAIEMFGLLLVVVVTMWGMYRVYKWK
jgi:uncharacterized membrane protein